MKNALSELFPKSLINILEEGKKKLGNKYIPYPDLDVKDDGKDYIPVILDGEGDGYLWVKSGRYYKKNYRSLFSRWKDVTDNLKEEVSKIYSRETKISLPSKVAKFCGNISVIIEGKDYESNLWVIPEISIFGKSNSVYSVKRFS